MHICNEAWQILEWSPTSKRELGYYIDELLRYFISMGQTPHQQGFIRKITKGNHLGVIHGSWSMNHARLSPVHLNKRMNILSR